MTGLTRFTGLRLAAKNAEDTKRGRRENFNRVDRVEVWTGLTGFAGLIFLTQRSREAEGQRRLREVNAK